MVWKRSTIHYYNDNHLLVKHFNMGHLCTEGIVPYSEVVLADKFISSLSTVVLNIKG